MAQIINEARRMQQLAGILKEDQIDEGLQDLALKGIAVILASGAAVVARYAGLAILNSLVSGISNIGSRIKSIVAPSQLDRFAKVIENDEKFNRDFVELLEKQGGHKKIWIWGFFIKDVTELPSFQEKFTAFIKENNITDADAERLLEEIRKAMVETMRADAEFVINDIKKKFPEVK
jgi:hypothetical protein